MNSDEIKFVEMPPPDMPGALAAKAIDAYFVGEPFCSDGQHPGEQPTDFISGEVGRWDGCHLSTYGLKAAAAPCRDQALG